MLLLQKTHQGWQELMVSSNFASVANLSSPVIPPPRSHPRLYPVLSPSPTPASTLLGLSSRRFENLPIGTRVEVSAAAFRIARKVGDLLDDCKGELEGKRGAGGCALIMD